MSRASGVVALIRNSRSILPVYRDGSLTISSDFVYASMLPASLAASLIAHCPNRVFRVAACLSASSLPIASSTSIIVPVASSCIAAATPVAVMPRDFHASFCALVAEAPLFMFTSIRLILVAATLDSEPIDSMAFAIAAIAAGSMPAIPPSAPLELTTSAISAALAAPLAAR